MIKLKVYTIQIKEDRLEGRKIPYTQRKREKWNKKRERLNKCRREEVWWNHREILEQSL